MIGKDVGQVFVANWSASPAVTWREEGQSRQNGSQDSESQGRSSKPGAFEYEAEVPTIQPRHSVYADS
jgi:hypothetical protein